MRVVRPAGDDAHRRKLRPPAGVKIGQRQLARPRQRVADGQPPRPVALAGGEDARRIVVTLAAAGRAKIGPEGGDRRRGRLAIDGMQHVARPDAGPGGGAAVAHGGDHEARAAPLDPQVAIAREHRPAVLERSAGDRMMIGEQRQRALGIADQFLLARHPARLAAQLVGHRHALPGEALEIGVIGVDQRLDRARIGGEVGRSGRGRDEQGSQCGVDPGARRDHSFAPPLITSPRAMTKLDALEHASRRRAGRRRRR